MKLFLIILLFFFCQDIFCQNKGVGTYIDWDNKIQYDSVMEAQVAYQYIENGHITWKIDSNIKSVIPFRGNVVLPFKEMLGFSIDASSNTANWTTGDENSIDIYQVQQSPDTIKWATIGTVSKGKSSYTYPLPEITAYYRVYATGADTFGTRPILLTVAPTTTNSVTISSPAYKSTSLTWTVTGEKNVKEYLIEKSSDGKTWTQTTRKPDIGNGKYTYRLTRTIRKYQYRITPIYADGKPGKTAMFK